MLELRCQRSFGSEKIQFAVLDIDMTSTGKFEQVYNFKAGEWNVIKEGHAIVSDCIITLEKEKAQSLADLLFDCGSIQKRRTVGDLDQYIKHLEEEIEYLQIQNAYLITKLVPERESECTTQQEIL